MTLMDFNDPVAATNPATLGDVRIVADALLPLLREALGDARVDTRITEVIATAPSEEQRLRAQLLLARPVRP